MFDLTIQLSRTNELLERIANALERAVGPGFIPPDGKYVKRGPEAIVSYGNQERLWLKENATNLIREKGLAPALEQELLDETLQDYDQSVESQALGPEWDPLVILLTRNLRQKSGGFARSRTPKLLLTKQLRLSEERNPMVPCRPWKSCLFSLPSLTLSSPLEGRKLRLKRLEWCRMMTNVLSGSRTLVTKRASATVTLFAWRTSAPQRNLRRMSFWVR